MSTLAQEAITTAATPLDEERLAWLALVLARGWVRSGFWTR